MKAQASAEAELAVAISGYQVNKGPNHIDYLTTEAIQSELKTVVVRNAAGKKDFVRTLSAVRQVILRLPDHPARGAVQVVIDAARSRNQN